MVSLLRRLVVARTVPRPAVLLVAVALAVALLVLLRRSRRCRGYDGYASYDAKKRSVAGVRWGKCRYASRELIDGTWTCPPGFSHYMGDNWMDHGLGWDAQCAESAQCKKDATATKTKTGIANASFDVDGNAKKAKGLEKKATKTPEKKAAKTAKASLDDPAPGSAWKKGTATQFAAYPECCRDPTAADHAACRQTNACRRAGFFRAFAEKKSREWVADTNVVAFSETPNDRNLEDWDTKWKNKKVELRDPQSGKTLVAAVVDTCDDADCGGCCTRDANKHGVLIDLEHSTAKRLYGAKLSGQTPIEWRLA